MADLSDQPTEEKQKKTVESYRERLELLQCGCMTPPTIQVLVYVHVSLDSCNMY